MDYSLELTRPFRALRLWLTLKFYGEEVLAAALREKRILAAYLAEELASVPHITLVTDPDLSILAFRFSPKGDHSDQGTKDLLARINTHPEVFLSSTQIGGMVVIRVAILSFRTHMETVEKLLQIIRLESDKIAAEMGVL
jgi:glutamate/tyrosine decarboxylase-like PLP-dependent enzyme